MTNNRKSKTSSFGVSSRENHDSSLFYSGGIYSNFNINKNIKYIENDIPKEFINSVIYKDGRFMDEIPDNSVHIMITSPPYNVGKEYDDDMDIDTYLKMLYDVFSETYRVLVPGGRACINIANIGRKPYIPLHSFIIDIMLNIGFLMRGEIIWDKGLSSISTAWGSWMKANNPVLRDSHEYILVFSKDTFSLKNNNKNNSTIKKEEFLEFTKSIWRFKTDSAKRIGHPSPYPIDLPYRLIQLYTFENNVVLDPFCGSGTTFIAAIKTNRRYVGYEINKEYVDLSNKRINEFIKEP